MKEEVDIQVDPKDLKLAMVASRILMMFLTHQFVFFTKLENDAFSEIKLQESEIVASKFIAKMRLILKTCRCSGQSDFGQLINSVT